jgi:Putative transposase/Transposase zinc-binding domain
MTPTAILRPRWEVADVIREYGGAFLSRHGGRLTGAQKKALRDLARCRTAVLGGHVSHCLDCGHDRIAYNSCRNRHCPKCQALARARWLAHEAEQLLPVEYFHVVFTLPEEVADLARTNPTIIYDLLMTSAAATLRDVAANPRRLGASIGMLLVLHTWGQNLHHHPHVHAVVTGGGLSCNTRGVVDAAPRWVACRPGFFLPVRVLSRVFRGKFLAGLRQLFDMGKLVTGRWSDPRCFADWLSPLFAREWVVYAKRPFGGPAQVLKYLARYTHRVAISNSRLVEVSAGQVTFGYKDYADGHRSKTMTLSADEFLRRFVQHVLPTGFVKVRHYGLLANRRREENLTQCRRLLLVETIRQKLPDAAESAIEVAPVVEPCCPHCGSQRLVAVELPRGASVPAIAKPDTS